MIVELTIHYDQQLHTAIIQYIPQQSLKSRAIKGKEKGVAVGGCCSSVAERWQLKPEALGLIPGGATFLFLSLRRFKGLRTVTAPIVLIRQSLSVFGLWGSPIHRTPPCCDYAHNPL